MNKGHLYELFSHETSKVSSFESNKPPSQVWHLILFFCFFFYFAVNSNRLEVTHFKCFKGVNN